jgi:hypothetical protein
MIPFRASGLRAVGEIRRARTQRDGSPSIDACEELPPLPAVTLPIADQPRLSPTTAVDVDVDARDGRGAGPGHAANRHLAARELLVRCRFGDE